MKVHTKTIWSRWLIARALLILGIVVLMSPVNGMAQSATAINEISPEARLASNAVVLALRNMPIDAKAMSVRFEKGISNQITDPIFKLNGFALIGVNVEEHVSVVSNPTHRQLIGTLMFKDGANRGVMINFLIKYKFEKKIMVIYQATTRYVSFSEPTMSWFVVPASKVPANLFDGSAKLMQLQYYIMNNGLNKMSANDMQTVGDYYIFGLVMDRMADNDKITVSVAIRENGSVKPEEDVPVYSIGGWRIAVFGGRFAPAVIGKDLVLFARMQLSNASGKLEGNSKTISMMSTFPENPLFGTTKQNLLSAK